MFFRFTALPCHHQRPHGFVSAVTDGQFTWAKAELPRQQDAANGSRTNLILFMESFCSGIMSVVDSFGMIV